MIILKLSNYLKKLEEVKKENLALMPLLQYPPCLKSYVKANKLYVPERKARTSTGKKTPMSEATKQLLRERKANMTAEQKEVARLKANARAKERRANMTAEQKLVANAKAKARPARRTAAINIQSMLRGLNTPKFSMPVMMEDFPSVPVDLMPINAFGNKVLTKEEKRKATIAAKKASKKKI